MNKIVQTSKMTSLEKAIAYNMERLYGLKDVIFKWIKDSVVIEATVIATNMRLYITALIPQGMSVSDTLQIIPQFMITQ